MRSSREGHMAFGGVQTYFKHTHSWSHNDNLLPGQLEVAVLVVLLVHCMQRRGGGDQQNTLTHIKM